MGRFSPRRYESWRTLLKALQTAIAANLAIELVRLDLPTTAEEWKSRGAQLAITLAMAVGRGVWNMWKTREIPGSPFYNIVTPWMVLILVPALTLGGCATLGVAGVASSAKQTTRETTPDGGTFEHITEAKGEVDKALFDFTYKGNPDNSWEMSIGQDSEGVTSPQMQAAIAANVAMYQALFAALPTLIQALSPVPSIGDAPAQPVTLPQGVDLNQVLQLLQGLKK